MKRLNELLGTRLPIIQGGMANIAGGAFAAACSNAGALGVIAAGGMRTPDALREQIRICRERTDQPFGVNLMLMNPIAGELAQVIAQERVAVVTTGAGNPGQYIPAWKDAGIKVIPVVAAAILAKRLERAGIDAVIAEGAESGGHVGEMTTMALVPQVADAVDIPVIAAGGIGDGRGFAAAFMLGAEAVQMGTRFVVARESIAHEAYKQKIIAAKDIDSEVTGMSHGHPVRQLRNRMTREYLKLEKAGASFEELEKLTVGALCRAVTEGDTANGTLMAGQIAGLVDKEQTCREIIAEIMEQAASLLHGYNG